MLAGKYETQRSRRFACSVGWTGSRPKALCQTPPADCAQGRQGPLGEVASTKEEIMNGNGRIFRRPRSPYWWISYYLRGEEYRESSHSTDNKEAGRFLKHRLREVGADRLGCKSFVGPSGERVRVAQLLEALEADYRLREVKAWPQFLSHLRPIRQAFGNRRALEISEEMIDRYISDRRAAGKAVATVNRETGLLAQAFGLARRRKLLSSGPTFRRLSEAGNTRQGFFSDGDFKALLQFLPDYLLDFTRFAYLSAWRKGEIASLAWTTVDREGRMIHLRPQDCKNGEGRSIPLEGQLWAIIERRWKARPVTLPNGLTQLAGHVFHRNGSPVGDFRQAWASACEHAGVSGKLFHDLRRTSIRNMLRGGTSEVVAMQISGHRTRAVFDRYNITSEKDLRDAVRKTETYLNSVPSERSPVPLPPADQLLQ
jgi:integrase